MIPLPSPEKTAPMTPAPVAFPPSPRSSAPKGLTIAAWVLDAIPLLALGVLALISLGGQFSATSVWYAPTVLGAIFLPILPFVGIILAAFTVWLLKGKPELRVLRRWAIIAIVIGALELSPLVIALIVTLIFIAFTPSFYIG